MTEAAPAKVNLCLYLGPIRDEDGRHELVSVVQSLAFGDELALEASDGPDDEVVCAGVDGPNLAAAALAAFRQETGWRDGHVRLRIDKRVPVAAGMGGGSADAAAALRLIRAASGRADEDVLLTIAERLGADVPAQVRPGRTLTTGAGERLERLAPPPAFGVLVLPSVHALATGDVFAEADRLGLPRDAGDLAERDAAVRAGLGAAPFGLPTELLVNDLEPAARSLCPALDEALGCARAAGADHAMVTGSGPTVVGLFADPAGAERAAADLATRVPPAIATRPVEVAP